METNSWHTFSHYSYFFTAKRLIFFVVVEQTQCSMLPMLNTGQPLPRPGHYYQNHATKHATHAWHHHTQKDCIDAAQNKF